MTDHLAHLAAAQNADGGWAYIHGTSWTEPTAYALLALRAGAQQDEVYRRGVRWLHSLQRDDGGWSPQRGVTRSTWVTALALLVCAGDPQAGNARAATEWLLSSVSGRAGFIERLRTRLLDGEPEPGAGWSFFPETAGWVVPTAAGILALSAADRRLHDPRVLPRIAAAREFLSARRCGDGGWNHGSAKALGYESGSYPETTGLALLALRGFQAPSMDRSLDIAQRHFESCRSPEGLAWLQLALRGYGRNVSMSLQPVCRTVVDHALLAITSQPQQEVFEP